MTGQRALPETEPVAVNDKVRDVMLFTVPGLDYEEDLSFVDADVPEDGMEACWAVPAAEGADDTIAYSIPEYTTAICAPSEERAMIAAAGEVGLLPMPAPVPFEEILDGVVRDVVSKVVDQVLAEPIPQTDELTMGPGPLPSDGIPVGRVLPFSCQIGPLAPMSTHPDPCLMRF